MMTLTLAAIVGAAAFRWRGGWLNDTVFRTSNQFLMRHALTRAIFAVAIAAFLGFSWSFVGVAVGLFLASCLPLWNSIDLGRIEGGVWSDRITLVCRGLFYTVMPAAVVAGMHLAGLGTLLPFWIIPAGALMWPAYEIGWRLPINWDRLALRQGPEIGEALFGACLGLAFYLTA